MIHLTTFSMRLTNYIYDPKSLRLIRYIALMIVTAIGIGAFFAYSLHYQSLIQEYGNNMIIMSYSPYVLIGGLAIIYNIIKKNLKICKILLITTFIPSTLLTEYGLTADIFLVMAIIVSIIEKNHRKKVVSIVSMFSKEYSPMYAKRLSNKNKYRSYLADYKILDLVSTDDYSMLSEREIITRNIKTGLSEKSLERTFKIKGVFGKVTVKDDLFASPQRKFKIGR